MGSPSLTTLLEKLAASDVEFIVVGMLAAVAQGAPVTTYVLGLETIIELKRGSTRAKDQYVLPVLEETLRRAVGGVGGRR